MVEIRDLTAGYGIVPVLKDLSLTFPEGKLTAIIGPNGCGKSTLLRAIMGLTPKVTGSVKLDGAPLLTLPPGELARQVAYLPQERPVPNMTVGQLVLHGRFPYLQYPRRYRAGDREAARAALARMGLSELAQVPLAQLSGGIRQKCRIAMALCQDTPVLLLDEPLSFLDISHQLELMALCRELARQGKTMVLVLHQLSLALQWADEIVLMEAGRIRQTGIPRALACGEALPQVFGVDVRHWDTPLGTQFSFHRKGE